MKILLSLLLLSIAIYTVYNQSTKKTSSLIIVADSRMEIDMLKKNVVSQVNMIIVKIHKHQEPSVEELSKLVNNITTVRKYGKDMSVISKEKLSVIVEYLENVKFKSKNILNSLKNIIHNSQNIVT